MKTGVTVLGFLLLVGYCYTATTGKTLRSGRLEKRAEDVHSHEEDSHGHGAGAVSTTACPVTGMGMVNELMELAEKRPSLRNCSFELGHHGDEHEENGNEEEDHVEEGVCSDVVGIVTDLLVHLNVSTECCLEQENISSCATPITNAPPTSNSKIPAAQAYGYGFLMVLLLSLTSLVGLAIIPITKSKKLKAYYHHIYALLIALGASALFCDAILHLIPEAFGLHDHGAEGDGHAHEEEEEEDKTILWRSLVVVLGVYIFFLFEFVLHSWTANSQTQSIGEDSLSSAEQEKVHLQNTENGQVAEEKEANANGVDTVVEATFPHGTSLPSDSTTVGMVQPKQDGGQKKSVGVGRRVGRYILNIKPLAWIIIVGDGLHNFADGLAIGAAISQSLSLGISTSIAIIFHEIPHELGDFSILLSTGMVWYAAIFVNFISALTAVMGFFVGVAIGTNSTDASYWILGVTAGVFLYLALVDLLPELIHTKDKGCARFATLVLINIGFFISFVVLFLLSYYEEDLNSLVTV